MENKNSIMIITFESFTYNEGSSISKEQIEKALKIIQSKLPYEKFSRFIKKHKDKILFLLKKYTNGKDTVYGNKLMVENEGFKDTFFYEIFIDIFNDDWVGKIMGVFVWAMSLVLAFLVYLLGLYIYLNFIYTPMDRGVVQGVGFTAAHTDIVPVTTMVGKTAIVTMVPIFVPDTWSVTVKEVGGTDTEGWETTSSSVGDQLSKGDTISWNDAIYNVTKGK